MTKPIIVVKVPCKLLYVIQVKEFLIKYSTSWPYLIAEFLVAYITIVASDWPRTFFTPKVFLFSINIYIHIFKPGLHAWFLEIAFVWEVGMHVCLCVYGACPAPGVCARHQLHDHVIHWEYWRKKTWRIVVICQICQNFPLKVFYCTVS